MIDHTPFDAPSQSLPVEFQELVKTPAPGGSAEGPNLNSIGPSLYSPPAGASETPPPDGVSETLPPVQVLGAYLDTLYHNFKINPIIFDSWREPLQESKLLAQAHPERKYQLPGTELYINASGRAHYKYILVWPGRGELMISYGAVWSGIRVRLYSSYIAGISTYLGCTMAARELAASLFGDDNIEVIEGEQVAELHLAVDMVGLSPSITDLQQRRWTCNASPHVEEADYPGDKVESMRWGNHASAISVVLYNKGKEIREASPDKIYLHETWTGRGWDGEQDVYRVEFRFSREWLRECSINSPHDVDLSGLLAVGMQWLQLREVVPSDSNNRRWPVAQAWAAIRDQAMAILGDLWKTYARDYVPKVSAEQLSAQIGGCLACVGALAGALDPDGLWLFVRRVFESRWAKLDVSFSDLVEQRRLRYMLPVLQE